MFQMCDVGKAHAAIESGLTTGKLVLCTDQELAKMQQQRIKNMEGINGIKLE